MDRPPLQALRPERDDDRAAIRALHTAAFEGAAEAELVDALRASGRLTLSLVGADEAGAVMGHVAFSPACLDGAAEGLGLAPVAVAAGSRRRGLADALIRAGLAAVERDGWPWVVVLGAPAYYRRFGFRAASERGLVDEFGGGDAFMVLELRAGALPAGGGVVRYAPDFDVFKQGPVGESD
jgi:putative acetyltransferase